MLGVRPLSNEERCVITNRFMNTERKAFPCLRLGQTEPGPRVDAPVADEHQRPAVAPVPQKDGRRPVSQRQAVFSQRISDVTRAALTLSAAGYHARRVGRQSLARVSAAAGQIIRSAKISLIRPFCSWWQLKAAKNH